MRLMFRFACVAALIATQATKPGNRTVLQRAVKSNVKQHRLNMLVTSNKHGQLICDDSQLHPVPARFALTRNGAKLTVVTGTALQKDGERWHLDIVGDALTGSFMERFDGQIVARYTVLGSRVTKDPAEPR
ncbi:MAG: hypothetical protein ACI91B_002847 [Planctomycetota bacterium]|jgi:hypothetical protein